MWIALILAACALPAARGQSNIHLTPTHDPEHPDLHEAVLFPFDCYSVPFRHGLEMALISGHKEGVVLRPGPAGSADSQRIDYYGSVARVGNTLRMWYRGSSTTRPNYFRVCYATSADGLHWDRPNLGLVELNGNRNNNLVDLDLGSTIGFAVIYDPDDPDPTGHFKMFAEAKPPSCYGYVAYSPDGLHWKASPNNPVVKEIIEPSGLTKHDGMYYLNFQNAGFNRRVLVTIASADFEHWSQAAALGFRRDSIPPRPLFTGGSVGAQVHLGAALWNRGNVILGLYGQWNAPSSNTLDDRRLMRMNLGLLVSTDALHFSEPIPDYKFVDAAEEGWSPANSLGDPPRLTQGQGMFNIADKTMTWYGIWGYRDWAIRAVSWQRDRLGYFQPKREPIEGQRWLPTTDRPEMVLPNFISAPIDLKKPGSRIFVNADGLSDHAELTVELLDNGFNPIKGFSGDDCIPLHESGLRQPIRWKSTDTLPAFDNPIRVRVNYRGEKLEDVRVYAAYIAA